MAEKNTEIKKKSREEVVREITDRKVSLAQERDSRVTLVRTNDTKAMLDMQPPIDKALKRLRDNMGTSPKYTNELVGGVINEFHNMLVDMYRFAERVTELSGLPFRPPRRFHAFKTGEDVPEEKTGEKTEETTETNVIDVEKVTKAKASKAVKAAG
ncbi:MAG: hypothetical protein JRE23_08525 [Deltaproteobacteria bacterium]|nr:hypothetical protein [Deltaproteobacteria bacterium]